MWVWVLISSVPHILSGGRGKTSANSNFEKQPSLQIFNSNIFQTLPDFSTAQTPRYQTSTVDRNSCAVVEAGGGQRKKTSTVLGGERERGLSEDDCLLTVRCRRFCSGTVIRIDRVSKDSVFLHRVDFAFKDGGLIADVETHARKCVVEHRITIFSSSNELLIGLPVQRYEERIRSVKRVRSRMYLV